MPVPNAREKRGARQTRGEKQSATIVLRNQWQGFTLTWTKIAALAETLRQHAERDRAYQLFDHRNELVRSQKRFERLRGEAKPDSLFYGFSEEIRRTEEDLYRYTDTWRDDWIETPMDYGKDKNGKALCDDPIDTWRRVLFEHGVLPNHLAKTGGDPSGIEKTFDATRKTAENRLRERRMWLTERLENCRDILARIDGPGWVRRPDGELERAFPNAWNIPMDRWGKELKREQVVKEIARLESAIGSLPD